MSATLLALALAVVVVPAAGSAEPPASAAVPAITVTPSTGLVSGQVVTVTGSGFTPSVLVILSDCVTGAALGYCGGPPPDSMSADASGDFTYQFTVARGTFDEAVYPPALVDCAQAPETCSVFAYAGATAERASAPISFDPSVAPPSADVTVTPTEALADHETLAVSGSGFGPASPVFVGQCAPGLRADFLGSPCAFPGGLLPADAQGDLSTTITVATVLASVADCSAAPGTCFVRVTSMAEPLLTVDTPLDFAPLPAVDVPPPVVVSPALTG